MHGAHDVVAFCQCGAVRDSCNAEIRNFNMSVRMDKNILRFYVPVHNTVSVGMFESAQNSDGNLSCQGRTEFTSFLDDRFQCFPLDVFHDQVQVFTIHTHIQQIDNIMMSHLARSFRFTLETADKLIVLIVFRAQDLDSDIVSCSQINCTVNNRHATHTDLLCQTVAVCEYLFFH